MTDAEIERELIAKMLHIEAEACLADIVPGDEIGRREANARAGALLTAVDDIRALKHFEPRRINAVVVSYKNSGRGEVHAIFLRPPI